MRVTLQPLVGDSDEVPLVGGEGALWRRRLRWACADAPLDLVVLAAEPIDLPVFEASEPVPGALARCAQAVVGTHAILLLANPATALGADRIALAEGVRLFALTTPADVVCWDAALALTMPVYGVAGTCVCELVRPRPANAISALAYGGFLACEGLVPTSLLEDRTGVRWELPASAAPAEADVIVRGGFSAAQTQGLTGSWTDQGNEGSVRVQFSGADGRCWTQPRFIMPRR